jgi:hypothetical protein
MNRHIRVCLERLKLTPAGLATAIGVTPRAVERWLDGSREMPEPVWRLIEVALILQSATPPADQRNSILNVFRGLV